MNKLMNNKTRTLLIGAALSGLTLTVSGCPSEQASASEGQCHGVNSCKGKGECSGKGHDCGGHNECKGKGWVKSTPENCQSQGGQFMPAGSKEGPAHNPDSHQEPAGKSDAAPGKSDTAPAGKTDAAPAGKTPAESTKHDAAPAKAPAKAGH